MDAAATDTNCRATEAVARSPADEEPTMIVINMQGEIVDPSVAEAEANTSSVVGYNNGHVAEDRASNGSSTMAVSSNKSQPTPKKINDVAGKAPETITAAYKYDNLGRGTSSNSLDGTPATKKAKKGPKKEHAIPPKANIIKPGPNDCLFGRGGKTNHHPGNKLYRQIVDSKKALYASSNRTEKPFVSMDIVKSWRLLTPPGRFLMQDKDTKMWYDVGDTKAREKTSQALREKGGYVSKKKKTKRKRKEKMEKKLRGDEAAAKNSDEHDELVEEDEGDSTEDTPTCSYPMQSINTSSMDLESTSSSSSSSSRSSNDSSAMGVPTQPQTESLPPIKQHYPIRKNDYSLEYAQVVLFQRGVTLTKHSQQKQQHEIIKGSNQSSERAIRKKDKISMTTSGSDIRKKPKLNHRLIGAQQQEEDEW